MAGLFADLGKAGVAVTDLTADGPGKHKPCKPLFFPKTEVILEYEFADHGEPVQKSPDFPESTPRLIFGADVCDAHALKVMDRLFLQDPVDPFYQARRANTVLAAILCAAKDTGCFCDQMIPRDEYLDSADMIFAELDAATWAVRVNGTKAIELLGAAFSGFSPDPSVASAFEQGVDRLAASHNPDGDYQVPDLDELKAFIENSFDSTVFDQSALACVGCGTCSYACPTCHCFDIVDEKTCFSGERRRNWDCCAFSLFTLHASGHNPRDAQGQRWRQRMLHKFSVYKDRFGVVSCVGCGRCIRLCPTGMNMLEMFEEWKISTDRT